MALSWSSLLVFLAWKNNPAKPILKCQLKFWWRHNQNIAPPYCKNSEINPVKFFKLKNSHFQMFLWSKRTPFWMKKVLWIFEAGFLFNLVEKGKKLHLAPNDKFLKFIEFIFYSRANVNFCFCLNRLIRKKETKKSSSSFLVNNNKSWPRRRRSSDFYKGQEWQRPNSVLGQFGVTKLSLMDT